ncbi:hypothetical protein ACFWFB_32865 [Streptomyces albidoflavus]
MTPSRPPKTVSRSRATHICRLPGCVHAVHAAEAAHRAVPAA